MYEYNARVREVFIAKDGLGKRASSRLSIGLVVDFGFRHDDLVYFSFARIKILQKNLKKVYDKVREMLPPETRVVIKSFKNPGSGWSAEVIRKSDAFNINLHLIIEGLVEQSPC